MAILLSVQAERFEETTQSSLIEQNGIVATIVAVTFIESFINTFFRVVASEDEFAAAKDEIIADLAKRSGAGARHNLKRWTKSAFKYEISETDFRWLAYKELASRRNKIVHFKSSHETFIPTPDIIFHGLADIGFLEELDSSAPFRAIETAIGVVELVAEARGISKDKMPGFVHQWTGIPAGLRA